MGDYLFIILLFYFYGNHNYLPVPQQGCCNLNYFVNALKTFDINTDQNWHCLLSPFFKYEHFLPWF